MKIKKAHHKINETLIASKLLHHSRTLCYDSNQILLFWFGFTLRQVPDHLQLSFQSNSVKCLCISSSHRHHIANQTANKLDTIRCTANWSIVSDPGAVNHFIIYFCGQSAAKDHFTPLLTSATIHRAAGRLIRFLPLLCWDLEVWNFFMKSEIFSFCNMKFHHFWVTRIDCIFR